MVNEIEYVKGKIWNVKYCEEKGITDEVKEGNGYIYNFGFQGELINVET